MYYQQGMQKIEVIVRKEDGGAEPKGTDTQEPSDVTTKTSASDTISNNRKKRIIKTNVTHAVAVTKQVIDFSLEYYLGGIGSRSGDQSQESIIKRKWEKVTDFTGIASATAMGAVYGAWGGPVGAVMGATIGAISTSASIGFKYLNREREYSYKIQKEENAIEYKRARAQTSLTNGRLR